jgi:hypothetical protein
MNVYWLFRDGSAPTEGPYTEAQLINMWRRGELHVRDDVCRKGQRRFSIERLILRWERWDVWKMRFRGLVRILSFFFGVAFFLAMIAGTALWFGSRSDSRNQEYGPIESATERPGVQTSNDRLQFARDYIRTNSLFPQAVQFTSSRQFKVGVGHVTRMDFRTPDANGAMQEHTWLFTYEEGTGGLLNVQKTR